MRTWENRRPTACRQVHQRVTVLAETETDLRAATSARPNRDPFARGATNGGAPGLVVRGGVLCTPMRALIVALVLAGSLPAASFGSGASVPTVAFAVLPAGWHATDAYAVSWNYRPNSKGWAPSMPRDGIAVTVIFPGRPRAGYPPLRLRLPKRPSTTLEGAPDTPEYRIRGHVHGRDVEILVDIRRPRPTAALLRLAQRVVSGIRFATNP